MEEHRCPVCNQICDEDAPFCTRCGWELSSPLKVGGISGEEERAEKERLKIAQRNWGQMEGQRKNGNTRTRIQMLAGKVIDSEDFSTFLLRDN